MPRNASAPSPAEQPISPKSEPSSRSTAKETNGVSKTATAATSSRALATKPAKKSSGPSRRGKTDPLEALRALFDDDDYDKVYAATEVILERKEGDGEKKYVKSWEDLAATTKQTAEEWMTFFEKIVLPQWQKDSPSKRKEIQKRVFEDGDQDEGDEQNGIEEQESEKAEPKGKEPAHPSTPPRNTAKTNGKMSKQRVHHSSLFEAYLQQFREERKGLEVQKAYVFWARDKDGARKMIKDDQGMYSIETLRPLPANNA